jgi:hypothetical protein
MSWIVSLYQFPPHIEMLADIPEDFVPPPLGSGAEVLAILSEFFPGVDFSILDWVEIQSDEVGAVLVIPDELIFDVALRDPSLELINRMCARTGWRAFDPEDGRLISSG